MGILLSAAVACSTAATPFAALDVGLVMRDSAGGHHVPRAALGPRVGLAFSRHLAAELAYGVTPIQEGNDTAAASAWLHQLHLRPVAFANLSTTRLAFGAGPSLQLSRVTLYDRGVARLYRTVVRLSASAFAGVEVPLRPLTLRLSTQGVWTAGRFDLTFGVGAAYTFGGPT
jgi:hypothetical protein